jgi:hypothetical protein
MTTPVRFWLDPICPWCWVTSLWIREVAAERELDVQWEPISLLLKNEPPVDSQYYAPVKWSYGLLRVLESVRATDGNTAVGELYLEYGRRIHQDGEHEWPVTDALAAIGIDTAHAAAFDDPAWDTEVLRRHDEGLALVGNDVGTPIISVLADDGHEVAIFGPVITKVPNSDDSLALWDSVVFLARLPEFHELKRTRTTGPEVRART